MFIPDNWGFIEEHYIWKEVMIIDQHQKLPPRAQ